MFPIPPVLDVPHARAAMRVEVVRAAPGKPFLAAVEIATDPHWHVYWRNPGDSGVPTRVRWSAPKGWKVEPLEFPTPRRFAPGGITAYGYEGKALFLARITPSATPGALSASVSWLVCSEACVQGSATLRARVPLGTARPGPLAKTLAEAERALPRPYDLRASAQAGRAIRLEVAFAPNAALPTGWKDAEFFPAETGVVDQGNPILATLRGRTLVFQLERSPFPEAHGRLKGLIVFTHGSRRQAATIAPPLEKGD